MKRKRGLESASGGPGAKPFKLTYYRPVRSLSHDYYFRYNLHVTLCVLVNGGLRAYPAGQKTSIQDPLAGFDSRRSKRQTSLQAFTQPRPKELT